jgi:hypothetical protein
VSDAASVKRSARIDAATALPDGGKTGESSHDSDNPDVPSPPDERNSPETSGHDDSVVKGSRETQTRLRNCTSSRLNIRTSHGRLLIPPLGNAEVDSSEIDSVTCNRAEQAGLLEREPTQASRTVSDTVIGWLFAGVLFGTFGALAGGDEGQTALGTRLAFGAIGVIALVFGVLLLLPLDSLKGVRSALLRLPGRLREFGYFAGVTLIVLAIPTATIYFSSDVPALVEDASAGRHDAVVALIGVGVQDLCIVGASALPVVLYFVFDREKLRTLRTKFAQQIFRLDPSIRTVRDMDAKYGLFLDEAYGRQSDNRLLPGARSPILLATAVITLGWTISLLDTSIAGSRVSESLTSLLTPAATAPTFAFLGAYFFTVNSVLRGYVRGDLRPKTYAQVAIRIVAVVVLAFVLDQLIGGGPSSPALLTLAFAAGIFPEFVLVRLSESLRGAADTRRGRMASDRLARAYEDEQLTELEGIDIYDRARLLNEGVTNIQALAHHDLVELLLKTRIPAGRLLDWVDQAILYVHCTTRGDAEMGGESQATVDSAERYSRFVRASLRRYGIRTATDLVQAHHAARERNQELCFYAIVPPQPGRPSVLETILDATTDDEWMPYLMYWRSQNPSPSELLIPEGLQPECLESTGCQTPVIQ